MSVSLVITQKMLWRSGSMEKLQMLAQINDLILNYDFPSTVLEDVNKRLSDSQDAPYIKQQLRYLINVVESGLATPRKEEVHG